MGFEQFADRNESLDTHLNYGTGVPGGDGDSRKRPIFVLGDDGNSRK